MSDLIDRQDAIDAIHEDADWLAAQGSDWQVERMERDKSILMSLPSAEKAQLSGEDATFDCISRQAAIDAINAYLGLSAVSRTIQNMTSIEEILENLPSAEPEIIRCRDCKHHDGIRCFRWNSTIITGFDDFCSNAERRTDV